MNCKLRRYPARKRKHPQIADDQRVYAAAAHKVQIRLKRRIFVGAGHRVDGEIHPNAALVRIRSRARQFLIGKIPGRRAHAECAARKINRVRAVKHGRPQLFKIACRSKQFRLLFHAAPPLFPLDFILYHDT